MRKNLLKISHQRGAFSLLAAATLLVLLMFLGVALDTGRLYLEQRRLQKIADMAAIESLLRLPNSDCSTSPGDAQLFAIDSAKRNNFLNSPHQNLNTECVAVSTVSGLRETTASASGDAVQTITSSQVKSSIVLQAASWMAEGVDNHITLTAVAAAQRPPAVAAFTVGSQLLRLNNNKLLGQLLQTIGLDVDYLTLLDSHGLANTSVSTSGLLEALGVNLSVNELKALSPAGLVELVNTQVGLLGVRDIVDLSTNLVGDSVLQGSLSVLGNAILSDPLLDNANLQLFGSGSEAALIRLNASGDYPPEAVMDTQINLGDLIATSLLAGYAGRSLIIPDLNLLGLLDVELGIIEPPSIGIGPIGTKAYNAQIRLYLDVNSNHLIGGLLSWLTNTVLGTQIHLPIWIDLATAQGTLTDIDCSVNPVEVDILVDSSLLNVCIGEVPDDLKWSTANSCLTASSDKELIRLLGIPLLTGKAEIAPLYAQEQLTSIQLHETQSTEVNPLSLGSAVDNIIGELLDLLSGLFRRPASLDNNLTYSEAGQPLLLKNLATQYLQASTNNGFYNVDAVTALILNGSNEYDSAGNQVLPALIDEDWMLVNSIPTSCLLTTCPVSYWNNGTFSQAFNAYTKPGGLLDLLGISTLNNGYRSCGGLLNVLLTWNNCIEYNLVKFLTEKPGGIDLSQNQDGNSIADSSTQTVNCSGTLCLLLEPVLELLKPLLSHIGDLLTGTITDVLGLNIGQTDVSVESATCGAPSLIH